MAKAKDDVVVDPTKEYAELRDKLLEAEKEKGAPTYPICNLCSLQFRYASELEEHLRAVHGVVRNDGRVDIKEAREEIKKLQLELNDKEKDLAAKEEELNAREADLKAREDALAAKATGK